MEYVPERGHVVWLEFSPQVGREQAGKRPALVVTERRYNEKTGLMLACPITSKAKGYPFEVGLGEDASIYGVVLADQLRSLDWRGRNAEFIESAEEEVVEDVFAKVAALLAR